jgi:hypothetical protein
MSDDYSFGAGGDFTLDLALGIPFIFKCSCWDATDKLVYTKWYDYVNQTGTQEFNLACPAGSTRQPRSLIVVRYRQPTPLSGAVTINTVGTNIINSTNCHSIDTTGAAVITTDITAYYVSIDNDVSRVGTTDTCKLGIGRYRLMKYELNFPANLKNDLSGELTTTNCESNDSVPGTCEGAANRYRPVSSGTTVNYQSLYSTDFTYDRITNVPETCNNCTVNTGILTGKMKERTWANRNETTKLGLVPNTAWQPPEFICVADCENSSYQNGGVCISTMTGLCAAPILNFAPDGVPPVINSSGNDNLVYIKIYNTEDPTQYECVPVLYDPDLIKQYELCES